MTLTVVSNPHSLDCIQMDSLDQECVCLSQLEGVGRARGAGLVQTSPPTVPSLTNELQPHVSISVGARLCTCAHLNQVHDHCREKRYDEGMGGRVSGWIN